MTTVFLSGSRKISRIGSEVRGRLENMVQNGLTIVTGDANGADKAMQSCLHELGYSDITVYFVGAAPRNNVGNWPTRNVVADAKLQGREFYAQKDRAMADIADLGFVLWDGKSSGSVQNMLWLVARRKAVVVYYAPEKQFYNFRSENELVDFLSACDDETLDDLGRKVALPERLKKAHRTQQVLNL
ncbi:hypothetical protein TSA1_27085 [Bradyrhizobium nitroreducens]|uniref:Uncharacterized protein n=1 Tax=Bradyrhizobium nitroreducens TaxID=709803 RepID=A0A2M6UHE6_9BRAD|nr:hypothetical protein [Bradyrhizobium nitroreducens]PIT04030.1 hypothetical protein TSA1_27085 [Bradyrhizobium nitroreducens]